MSLPVHVFFAVPRSGSTLFMSIMANLTKVAVTSRTILMGNTYKTGIDANGKYIGNDNNFLPDYSIYETGPFRHPAITMAEKRGASCLVTKEEVGNNCRKGPARDNECGFQLYPNEEALASVKPVFTFRNPVTGFASWQKRGWDDLSSFIVAYKNVFAAYQTAKRLRPETVAYKFEDLTGEANLARPIFQAICADWDLKFDPKMLQLDEPFADRFLFWHPREEKIYTKENPKGIFTTILSAKTIVKPATKGDSLTKNQRKELEKHLMPLYASVDTSQYRGGVSCKRSKNTTKRGSIPHAQLS